jgi:hypothetical protein
LELELVVYADNAASSSALADTDTAGGPPPIELDSAGVVSSKIASSSVIASKKVRINKKTSV